MSARARIALAVGLLALAGPPALADRETDLVALRDAIRESRERVAEYESEERGLLDAIEALDRSAALLSRDVARARRDAEAARAELARVEADAAGLERRLTATRRALRARAVALYRAGEVGPLRVLFSAEDLPDFLARMSALRRLVGHDADLLARYRGQVTELEAARTRARDSAEEVTRAEAEIEARSSELAAERARKRALVRRLHESRTRERDALVELERAADALEQTLASLDAGTAAPAAVRPAGPRFATLRRELYPPVSSPVARGFGRQRDEEFGTSVFHSGLLYRAPLGMPVESVAAGSVRFAGWFRGYGRLVIVDHGDRYFSVFGHLADVAVAVGDPVAARQVIGSVGETGSITGPQLYFELRRGGDALDPADWLRLPGGSR